MQAGRIFGERSLLFDEPRNATIISLTCQCWVLQKQDFLEIINDKTPETWSKKKM